MTDQHECIRKRAYEIWEQEGRPEGREEEHWKQAAREMALDSDHTEGGDRANSLNDDPSAARSTRVPTTRRFDESRAILPVPEARLRKRAERSA